MSNKKKHIDDCGCEHHPRGKNPSHHIDDKCPTDLVFDNLIETLKKEFKKDFED